MNTRDSSNLELAHQPAALAVLPSEFLRSSKRISKRKCPHGQPRRARPYQEQASSHTECHPRGLILEFAGRYSPVPMVLLCLVAPEGNEP